MRSVRPVQRFQACRAAADLAQLESRQVENLSKRQYIVLLLIDLLVRRRTNPTGRAGQGLRAVLAVGLDKLCSQDSGVGHVVWRTLPCRGPPERLLGVSRVSLGVFQGHRRTFSEGTQDPCRGT